MTDTARDELQLDVWARELSRSALERALSSEHEPPADFEWVPSVDFTVVRGKQQIVDYMRTWETQPGWQTHVEFLEERERDFGTEYHYRALWAIPTSRRPVPRCTAAVYFVFGISKTKPRALPVDVYFMIESNQWKHVPGKTKFREKWLTDVIESKAAIFDVLTF